VEEVALLFHRRLRSGGPYCLGCGGEGHDRTDADRRIDGIDSAVVRAAGQGDFRAGCAHDGRVQRGAVVVVVGIERVAADVRHCWRRAVLGRIDDDRDGRGCAAGEIAESCIHIAGVGGRVDGAGAAGGGDEREIAREVVVEIDTGRDRRTVVGDGCGCR